MRALTIRQPWVEAILHHGKAVENRTWSTTYRGPLLIAASASSKKADRLDALTVAFRAITPEECDVLAARTKDPTLPMGAIVGVVDLLAIHRSGRTPWLDDPVCPGVPSGCSRWGMPDQYHWTIGNPRALPEPIPAKGKLGLWVPDGDLITRVQEQLGGDV